MVSQRKRLVLAVPMGDPNGIGPEIIVKSAAESGLTADAIPLIIGDSRILEQAARFCGINIRIHGVNRVSSLHDQPGILNVIDLAHNEIDQLQIGMVQALAGQYAADYIHQAVKLALAGDVDGLVTTPVNKEAWQAARIPYIGHTEMLAELTKIKDPLTLFETQGLRVFFLSRHVSLRKACDLVTFEKVREMIIRSIAALRQLGIRQGTLAVAGLNPHSGEHGMFGDEEVIAVEPAVAACRQAGYDVVGPIGADSVFHQAHQGRYAAVLSLYHDQGHIATKTLDFERTIALTLGLPFLRTSVDHGTALDIAGRGIASPVSLMEAFRLGAFYGRPYQEHIRLCDQ